MNHALHPGIRIGLHFILKPILAARYPAALLILWLTWILPLLLCAYSYRLPKRLPCLQRSCSILLLLPRRSDLCPVGPRILKDAASEQIFLLEVENDA